MFTSPSILAWPSAAVLVKRLIFTVWAVMLLGILVRSYLMPQRSSVYPIFANAGSEWRAGVDVYDQSLPRPGLDKFRYAPIVAAFFAQLSALPPGIGGVLWRLINGAILFAGVLAYVRHVYPARPLGAWDVAILAGVLLPQSMGSLSNSQPNSLVIGCLLLGVAYMVREHWWAAALCLAIPVLFKVYPLAVVLLFLLVHPVRMGWRTTLCILAGLLLPFALQRPEYVAQLYQSWFHQVANDKRHHFELEYSYRDFHVLTRWVGWPMPEQSYQFLQLAVAGAIAALVLWRRRRGWQLAQNLRAALDLGICWILLFGPATENATYAIMAPILALAAWEAFGTSQPAWKRSGMAVIVGLFVFVACAMMFPSGRKVSFFLMPIGALLLFAERLTAHTAGRSSGAAPAHVPHTLARAA